MKLPPERRGVKSAGGNGGDDEGGATVGGGWWGCGSRSREVSGPGRARGSLNNARSRSAAGRTGKAHHCLSVICCFMMQSNLGLRMSRDCKGYSNSKRVQLDLDKLLRFAYSADSGTYQGWFESDNRMLSRILCSAQSFSASKSDRHRRIF